MNPKVARAMRAAHRQFADGGDVQPDNRSMFGRAADTAMDYAGRGLALGDLYTGGMLSSLAGLNPFTSYSDVMAAREKALAGVPRDAKALATEPINPLAAVMIAPTKLWHGTGRRFDKFDPAFMGSAGQGSFLGRSGFYFGRGPDEVRGYGRYVKEVDANLENPKIFATDNINFQLSDDDVLDLAKRGYDSVIMRLLDRDIRSADPMKINASLDQEVLVMDPRKLNIRRVYDQELPDDVAALEAMWRVGPYVWNDGPGRP